MRAKDNINNWFTSLFDQRFHPWGIRCSGQKILGDSPNTETNNPGEIDGYFNFSSKSMAFGVSPVVFNFFCFSIARRLP